METENIATFFLLKRKRKSKRIHSLCTWNMRLISIDLSELKRKYITYFVWYGNSIHKTKKKCTEEINNDFFSLFDMAKKMTIFRWWNTKQSKEEKSFSFWMQNEKKQQYEFLFYVPTWCESESYRCLTWTFLFSFRENFLSNRSTLGFLVRHLMQAVLHNRFNHMWK